VDYKQAVKPTQFIIYGISGHLSRTKILPGLYGLEKSGMLPEQFHIVGTSRNSYTREQIKDLLSQNIPTIDHITLNNLCDRIQVVDINVQKKDFSKLKHALQDNEHQHGLCFDRVHYLALPPDLFEPIVKSIGNGVIDTDCKKEISNKILIEKPFGSDLASAKKIQSSLHRYFSEEDIYLVDHYLAKEPVENILYFIRNNPVFADVWNCKHIRRVEITAKEELGIENRGEFYDNVGALRDMFQSHLLEVLALLTLDQPYDLTDESIQAARLELLQNIKPFDPDTSVRGQYNGYKEEVGNPKSFTETYATTVTNIDTDQWRTTSFILSSGKRQEKKQTTAKIYFASDFSKIPTPNTLTFEFYPEHSVKLGVNLKEPGNEQTRFEELRFEFPSNQQGLTGYQTIVLAALNSDRSVFTSTEESLVNWQTIQPLLTAWSKDGEGLIEYNPQESLT